MKSLKGSRQFKRVLLGALVGAAIPALIFLLLPIFENSDNVIGGGIFFLWWLVSLPSLAYPCHGSITMAIVLGIWATLGAFFSLINGLHRTDI
jgi:hypothetical protein